MRFDSKKWLLAGALALGLSGLLALAPKVSAGQGQGQPNPPPQGQPPATPTIPIQQQPGQTPPEAPKVDPQEEAAYKAFYETKIADTDRLIQLGEDFLKTYPESHYRVMVYARLTQAYFSKQQMEKMFAAGDKALALNPNDVDVLALIGWVLPHNYNPNDLDADQKLNRSEQYLKHALDLLATLQKPASLTDEEFQKSKNGKLSQCHSGLGLVYFRRERYADSVTELQQATQLLVTPDPVDLFVMGIDCQQLKHFGDAAAAFDRCAQIPSSLQDRCKQSMEQSKKLAATEVTPPKQ
jgi:tetratricopeptide (TPR) repeat protein